MDGPLAYQEIDVSVDPDAMVEYGIQSVPTTIILDSSGEQVAAFAGLPDRDELKSAMERALADEL